MAKKFYRYPPRPSSGAGTFSDNIVGQLLRKLIEILTLGRFQNQYL